MTAITGDTADQPLTRVLVLNTNSNERFIQLAEENIRFAVPHGVEVVLSFPDDWPTLIVDDYTAVITTPRLLEQVESATDGQFDAVLVNMHSDPGIDALREMLSVPVVGLGETSILLAASLADRFSMVTVRPTRHGFDAMDRRQTRLLGVEQKLASIRTFGGPSILGELLQEDRDRYVHSFVEECRLAVKDDGARAIYLAGSVFGYLLPNLVDEIDKALTLDGYDSIPIIEPMRAALNMARMLHDLGVRHRLVDPVSLLET